MDERFEFGENWQRFLTVVNEDRIAEAEKSLEQMLGAGTLSGVSFLDIGSGSGLFSLAARRQGARVHSFDYDPQSVGCTRELKRRFCAEDTHWTIERGDVLDTDYVESQGEFDVVYAWGVLHHTGDMWQALRNVRNLVAENGRLFVAIYNRQPVLSNLWRAVKRWFNRAPGPIRALVSWGYYLFVVARGFVGDLIRRRNPLHRHSGRNRRGMDQYRDVVDWLGGWPFEVATPEEISDFYRDSGFALERLETVGGKSGCNQYVFRRSRL